MRLSTRPALVSALMGLTLSFPLTSAGQSSVGVSASLPAASEPGTQAPGGPGREPVITSQSVEFYITPRNLELLTTGSDGTKRDWGPEQATGAPDTPIAGDCVTAWASRFMDQGEEWLNVSYDRPVDAVALLIYESYNPGALSRVLVYDEAGVEIEVFRGPDPTGREREMGVSAISLGLKDFKVKGVKLILDSASVAGWNEIDAVGLVDRQGQMNWASQATASSTYADALAEGCAPTMPDADEAYTRIQRLEAQIQSLEARIQELEQTSKAAVDESPFR